MEYESDYKVEYERLKKQKEEAEKVNCQILSQLQKKIFVHEIWTLLIWFQAPYVFENTCLSVAQMGSNNKKKRLQILWHTPFKSWRGKKDDTLVARTF